MVDYPFYDKQPGPERREKLNELYATWENAITNLIKGDSGWSPLIRAVTHLDRVVLELYDWTGGQGIKPTTAGYLGTAGYVSDISLAIDFRGPLGVKGDAATISVGTVTTTAPGTDATVLNTGTSSSAVFAFGIPRGATGLKGDTGTAATVSVGTVTTGAPGTNAQVVNAGTSSSAVFNFTIPRGEQGIQGVKGDAGLKGDKGDAATVSIGTVTTGAAGTSASVTNSGTQNAATFNFTIPRGDKGEQGIQGVKGDTGLKGDKGDTGTAATISVGTVTTGAPGTNAQVVNVGTSSSAVFNFTIPRGADGSGSGDMTKAVYDSLGNGVVNEARAAPWVGITGKPATFPPSAHTHDASDITSGVLSKERLSAGIMDFSANPVYYDQSSEFDLNDLPAGARCLVSGIVNMPPGEYYWYVECVNSHNGSALIQRAYTYVSNTRPKIALRQYLIGVWSSWQVFDMGEISASNLTSGTIPDARLSGTYTDVNITGNAATATKLATASTINGVSFDGTANITVADSTKLPLSGGFLTGTLSITTPGTADSIASLVGGSGKALEIKSTGIGSTAGSATIFFHRPDAYAAYLGLDTDNQLKFGGYAAGAVAHKIWHEGNDGASSGLDADLLDGQHGSYYLNASNINAGTVPVARLPALNASKTQVLNGTNNLYVSGGTYLNVISWNDMGTISTSTSIDLNTSLNHKLTAGASITLDAVNVSPGQSGDIIVSTPTARTVSWSAKWKFLGSVPNIGGAGETWVVSYKVFDANTIYASAVKVA